ncbi:lipid A biosynthesis lauroyl acyltransferase [Pseudoxanthomonas sp. CAU 1598]|uniref:Lipid A biosynthesis lauroyl acyltransferase n=2 Tax=Pseudomarimonas arenosa TaxID=2774145 RepID=A0AAW3ZP33_9GAMM|nr:lipid A biosynthesis lauroyl acyltransferase [Pseudomarimonas arenosa]
MTWPGRIAFAALWLLGAIPLSVLHGLASVLAWPLARLSFRESRVARLNLLLCFSQLDEAERRRRHRQVLRETLCMLLESGRVWTRPVGQALRWVREVRGLEHLQAARAGGRGVIVAAPHLGNWELFGHYLSSLGPLSIVYREPQWVPAHQILLLGRGGGAVEQLPAQPSSVRKMLKALRDGRLLGILPDQQPKVGEGEFAPFFGYPALTMTLLSRLAEKSAVEVVFGFAERLPRGGFRVHFLPAPEGIADADPVRAATALNQGVEACVARSPWQYQWTYKRFSWRPQDGSRNPYVHGHEAIHPPSEQA